MPRPVPFFRPPTPPHILGTQHPKPLNVPPSHGIAAEFAAGGLPAAEPSAGAPPGPPDPQESQAALQLAEVMVTCLQVKRKRTLMG